MKIHPSITLERLNDAAQRSMLDLDRSGFCIKCGEEHLDVDPDTENHICEYCDEAAVYGAEQLLFHVVS